MREGCSLSLQEHRCTERNPIQLHCTEEAQLGRKVPMELSAVAHSPFFYELVLLVDEVFSLLYSPTYC